MTIKINGEKVDLELRGKDIEINTEKGIIVDGKVVAGMGKREEEELISKIEDRGE